MSQNVNHDLTMQAPADIETSSSDYAVRFSGSSGRYLLHVQDASVEALVSKYTSGSVLDVGGGHGQLLDLYSRLKMDVTVHGSDEVCFARLGQVPANVRYVVADICSLPFEDRSFDVVVAVRLISHVDDWRALLTEMCRVARSCVVIDYPSKRSLNALTPLLFKVKRGIEKNTRAYTSFSHSQLKQAFACRGFPCLSEYKQFFLPMVVHRMLSGGALPKAAEKACRLIRLTDLFGSPVMLKAERDVLES